MFEQTVTGQQKQGHFSTVTVALDYFEDSAIANGLEHVHHQHVGRGSVVAPNSIKYPSPRGEEILPDFILFIDRNRLIEFFA